MSSFAVEQTTRKRSARQNELFDQLTALYLDRGFLQFTIEQAATALRCSKTTLYALADTREQLVRSVVLAFFKNATTRVEEKLAAEQDPTRRVEVYLESVAAELRPASAEFMEDVAAFAPAQQIYARNTKIAAERVRALILEGVELGAFREVQTRFIAEVVSSVMVRIQQREVAKATGLSDAEAYASLANLVVNGIVRSEAQ